MSGAIFTPASGSTPYPGTGTDVTFTFTAPSDKYSIFDGKIKVINSDNPTDYCEMDVHLETPRIKSLFFNIFEHIINQFPLLKTLPGL
jgi:hypothetical protein